MTGQRKYWKSYAKSNLKGNWGIAIAAMLAVVAVNFIGNIFAVQLFPGDSVFALVLSEIFVFIVSLIGMIFSTGYSYMQLNICRGRDYSLSDLLYMFHNQPDRVLVAGLVVALIDTVVQIPFYFLADDPEMGGIEALKASTHAMKGHIWQYLMLELSFVPLLFLSLFTLYIGLLWLMPYMQFTETAFYMYVTGELDQQRTDRQHTGIQEISDRTGDDYNSEA